VSTESLGEKLCKNIFWRTLKNGTEKIKKGKKHWLCRTSDVLSEEGGVFTVLEKKGGGRKTNDSKGPNQKRAAGQESLKRGPRRKSVNTMKERKRTNTNHNLNRRAKSWGSVKKQSLKGPRGTGQRFLLGIRGEGRATS